MKKHELIWVIVKLIGLYFIYEAITMAFAFFSSLLIVFDKPILLENSAGAFFRQFLIIAIFGAVGLYLLKDGSLLFYLLDREEPDSAVQQNLNEISIK